ncbi:glycosyl transferase [Pontibacillus halophilus JSM 076056 = DSM 19796]|uniref:4,4'-diaponeurosporenoate glycosyltransferase n=1 Tax=Pontibacillus halophilus JSM 076056 = DSM 19796 TaxID=1385510 RepID=A0A0A5GH12_9BACI|nr:glycosyltransferase [Pontibacillus halophilus]KGX91324.1 glycosyl transferase [Pontibacillus halophilus JSM 076056 = DSM 19796]
MTMLILVIALFWFVVLIDACIGLPSIQAIKTDTTNKDLEATERISVVVAAKDEALSIRETLISLVDQSYSNLEIIVVNDRSDDETELIIQDLCRHFPSIHSIHITELPEGWIGKNHALHVGSQAATGDVLVFIDADVRLNSRTIEMARDHLNNQQVDHLTLSPDLTGKGVWLRGFIAYFLFGFSYFKRPWTANQDDSRKGGMGIGAFQMIRRDTYYAIGTHAAFPTQPDDDLKLGQYVKKAGFKQRLVTGKSHLSVEWYATLKEALVGLEKNTFAGLHYSILLSFFAIIGTLLSQTFPYVTLLTYEGLPQLFSALAILFMTLHFIIVTRKFTTFSPAYAFLLPLLSILFAYSIARAVYLTYKRGGIHWRGTFYSINTLKRKD